MKRLLSIFCAISVAVLSSSCGSMQTEIDQTNQNLETIQSSMNPLQEESYKSGDSKNKSLEGLRLSQEDAYCVQWSGWTLEKYMEESSCIFYGKCIGKNATQHGSSELQFDIQKIYKGVYEPEIKMFHSLLSEPFEIGKEYLIFCGHDASVYSGKDIYGISTVICEMKDGLYHEGILGLEKENMQSILKQVSSYMEKHPSSNEVKINTDYCRSEKLDEIYKYADTVVVAKITGVFDNTQEDRTAYYFDVKDTLKGRVSGEQWIMAFKDSMKIGEEYLLLLSTLGAEANFFTMCSPQSVLPINSDKAKTILSLAGCSGIDSSAISKTETVKHRLVDAKTDGFDTVDELESAADLVVKAVRLPKEENVIKKSEGYVVSAYTFSEVKIEEIYKDSGSSLSKGDIITILENQAEDEETGTVYHIAGYTMMVKGCEYLLFLRESSLSGKKYYVTLGVNFGTVSLDDDGRDKVYAETGEEVKNYYEAYEAIWNEARAKYAKP